MSLTSLIANRRSAVAVWLAESFPETRSVASEANRRLRGGSAKVHCVIVPPAGVDHALVGTVVGSWCLCRFGVPP